ncbi:hypothetical protein [Mobilicoccus pelagius]|uniref:Carrier domain-containing protein n=1 Tax=Mobilicoccus pelagius NBRC 104925 TaxID=1089455 RepID=H5USD4_9MICO|nr:hypothetical protein [Mobilicoccus pelagius]GAB48642.1 hypothetical protein MOPEL_078_00310 [Mobilicoccus pelagius NBRC 104925]
MSKRTWNEVEQDLLDDVFYAHDAETVKSADDLAKAGVLDSLSIVAILETLIDASGDEEAFDAAEASDFRNLSTIRALYEKA